MKSKLKDKNSIIRNLSNAVIKHNEMKKSKTEFSKELFYDALGELYKGKKVRI